MTFQREGCVRACACALWPTVKYFLLRVTIMKGLGGGPRAAYLPLSNISGVAALEVGSSPFLPAKSKLLPFSSDFG